jgi:hypothetical protein
MGKIGNRQSKMVLTLPNEIDDLRRWEKSAIGNRQSKMVLTLPNEIDDLRRWEQLAIGNQKCSDATLSRH